MRDLRRKRLYLLCRMLEKEPLFARELLSAYRKTIPPEEKYRADAFGRLWSDCLELEKVGVLTLDYRSGNPTSSIIRLKKSITEQELNKLFPYSGSVVAAVVA